MRTSRARRTRATWAMPSTMKTPTRFLAFAAVPFLALSLAATRPEEKAAPMAAAGTYEVDGVHSAILFQCMHMNTSWAFGRFDAYTGKITFDPAKPETSTVEFTIDTSSVDTANPKRDEHLKSPDFLDVKQFPSATFKSSKVAKKSGTTYAVTGDLTLHGVTKQVTIDMDHTGGIEHPKVGTKIGFLGHLAISRAAYGINYMPDGLGDEIKLTFSIQANKQTK